MWIRGTYVQWWTLNSVHHVCVCVCVCVRVERDGGPLTGDLLH